MTSTTVHPMDLQSALELLHGDLPRLMGKADWDAVPASFSAAIARLQTGSTREEQDRAASDIRSGLTGFVHANEEVLAQVAELTRFRQKILPIIRGSLKDDDIADLLATSIVRGVVRPEPVAPSASRTRGISTKTGGIGGAKSLKLGNIRINLDKVGEFIAHSALITAHESTHPNPLLIGFAILLLANCAREAATIRIPEHDATVFWGLIQAQKQPGNSESVSEPELVETINAERSKVSRGPLTPLDILHSLNDLAGIKCVAKIEGVPSRWRITEDFKIKV
jgi:hypothetical protein